MKFLQCFFRLGGIIFFFFKECSIEWGPVFSFFCIINMVFQFCQMCSCCFLYGKKGEMFCWFFFPDFSKRKREKILSSGLSHHIAYFRVHSRAKSVYFSLSVLNILAISGTKGSSGLGSQSKEQIDNNTFEIVSAGDH